MAKAQLPAAVTAITGHVGTLQFQLGPSGFVIASKGTQPVTRTPQQLAAANAWTSMVKAWAKATTPTQKAGWTSFGSTNEVPTKCGSTAKASGFQAFSRSNTALQHVGKPLRSAAPSSFTSNPPGAITITYTAGPPATLTVTPTNTPSSDQIPVIKGTGPLYAGVALSKKLTRRLAIETAGSSGPWDVAIAWQEIFGAIKSGTKINLGLTYCDLTSGAISTTSSAQILLP
jgi:hypothetical protein